MYRPRDTTLWPCRPSIECYNYLCRRCGAAMDGCQIHRRKDSCDIWRDTWGERCGGDQCGPWADTAPFSPEQAAFIDDFLKGQQRQLQAQLAIADAGAATPDTPQQGATNPTTNVADTTDIVTMPQGSRASEAVMRLLQQQQQVATAEDLAKLQQAIYDTLIAGGPEDEEATLVTDPAAAPHQLQAQDNTLEYNPGLIQGPVTMPSGDTLYPGETTVVQPQMYFLPGTCSTACPNSGELTAPPASTSSYGTVDGTVFVDEDTNKRWVWDTRLPRGFAWEDQYQTAFYRATGTNAAAAAQQAAAAADQAEEVAMLQRLKAQEAAQEASDRRNIAAEKAEAKLIEAEEAAPWQ